MPAPGRLGDAGRPRAGDTAASARDAGHRYPPPAPAVLANMAATLDIISGGRLELGVGTGWNEQESAAYGIELGTPGQRSDRFEEACLVLTALLSARETTTFSGRYYQLADARCDPKPVQQPLLPLCVGGSGEKRTLRTAARFAHHWNFDSGTPAQFTRAREVLYQHCADLGRDPAEILLSAQVRFTGDPAQVAANAAAFNAVGAELAIVCLPVPHTAAVLQPLASALSGCIPPELCPGDCEEAARSGAPFRSARVNSI